MEQDNQGLNQKDTGKAYYQACRQILATAEGSVSSEAALDCGGTKLVFRQPGAIAMALCQIHQNRLE